MCDHKNATWEPVQIEYQPDGTARVWQEAFCQCGLLQLDYEPGEIRQLNPDEEE